MYSFFTKRFPVENCTTLGHFSKHILIHGCEVRVLIRLSQVCKSLHPSVKDAITCPSKYEPLTYQNDAVHVCINKATETLSNNLDSKSMQSVTIMHELAMVKVYKSKHSAFGQLPLLPHGSHYPSMYQILDMGFHPLIYSTTLPDKRT